MGRMDAHQLPLAGVEPDAPRPNHHLFFAVLPEPREAQAAADLAQTLTVMTLAVHPG